MSTTQPTPTNYTEAAAILAAGRTADSRDCRKIANNTTLETRDGGRIAVRLHRTDIVVFYKNGATVLDSGGWQTVTTKERFNRYLAPGLSVYAEKGEWYVQDRRPEFLPGGVNADGWQKQYRAEYRDGLLILPDHAVHSASVGAGGTGSLV
jgi:hypothetical protein